ncbi:MAG: PAS domain S-box protein [Burkholderiales bacterium]|nr:PAS domain S-box protein [Burkholderiales bacterium]
MSPPLGPTPPSLGLNEGTVFRALFAAHPDALLVTNPAGIIVMANPSASTLFGYTNEELLGLNVDALVPDNIRPRHASHRQAYGRDPQVRPMGTQMDLVAQRRDGSKVMVEIALSPLQSQGEPLVVAAIRDISVYPRVKQSLRRARYSDYLAQLSRLAVDSRDPQVLLDQVSSMAAQALQVQQATVLLLEPNRLNFRVASGVGLLEGEAIGSLVPNRIDSPPGFVLANGCPVTVHDDRLEQRFTVPPAVLHAGLNRELVVPLSDRGRIIGALTVRSRDKYFGDDEVRFLESLSNLLATSLQRAQSEEALNHAQRLESIGQLTGGIAHDFNNLLTVIQGNLQVLEDLPTLAQDGYAMQLVGAAARASKRGAELTGKLLAFSRRQVLQPSAVDVNALLDSLSDMLRRTLDQHIHIQVDAPPCPPCLADPGQLESALLNIAINARDAMPEGGILRFHAKPCANLPDDVRGEPDKGSAHDAGFVALAITDSGSGMSDEVKERVFEPFFTTKDAGRGTGLGLSTVHGFVTQSKGAIAINSTPGSGTTVTLYIPSVAHAQDAPEPADTSDCVPPGLRVLLVEDDAEVRAIVCTFLDTLGCKVTSCTSAEQALLTLTPDTQFDLLLTDIALGAGLSGTQLAAQAQERVASLGILLMSGFSAELLDADRDSPPSWELLRKPYTRDELARTIARVVKS